MAWKKGLKLYTTAVLKRLVRQIKFLRKSKDRLSKNLIWFKLLKVTIVLLVKDKM
jgi:hypothetical protein